MLRRDVQMSSGEAMHRLGPLIHVLFRRDPDVSVPTDLPRAVRASMVIDTGSVCTMIDDRTPRILGHSPSHYTLISGATGDPETRPVYKMEMIVRLSGDGESRDVTFRQEVVGLQPIFQREIHFGLLGRDYLASMQFLYDGPGGAFSLIARDSRAS